MTRLLKTCLLSLCYAVLFHGTNARAADLYPGITPQASANFNLSSAVDASGRTLVAADWTTSFVQTPPHPVNTTPPTPSTVMGAADLFYGAPAKSYNLSIGATADLFNGGPLFPGSYVYTPANLNLNYQGYSAGCTLAFRGSLGNAYDHVSPDTMKTPGGGTGAASASRAPTRAVPTWLTFIARYTPSPETPPATSLSLAPTCCTCRSSRGRSGPAICPTSQTTRL